MTTLTPIELQICALVATGRMANNRARKIKDKKIGNQSGLETDINGIAGEMVVAKAMGVWPNMTVGQPDEGWDLISPKGATVDVKTTSHMNGRLLAAKWKEPCDIYVLVTGEFPTYTIAGWAKGEELIREENLINLGHGEGYALTQDKLRKWGSK